MSRPLFSDQNNYPHQIKKKNMGFWEDLWEFCIINSNLLLFLATVALVILTLGYVLVTKRILEVTQEQIGLMQNPIIAMDIQEINLYCKKGRRNVQVILKALNLGKAPAHEIVIDSEIKLKYLKINGENIIPSHTDPLFWSFLRADDTLSQDSKLEAVILDFDGNFIDRVLQDSQEPKNDSIILTIYIYYKNNLNKYFKSFFEAYIFIDKSLMNEKCSTSEEISDGQPIYFSKRKFIEKLRLGFGPIKYEELTEEIEKRDLKRKKFYE